MLPIRKTPWRELTSLHRELDDMFSRVFGRHEKWIPSLLREEERFPAVDYVRKGDKVVVRAELPGLEPKDVDISVRENRLTIHGEKRAERRFKEEDYFMHELGHGVFERTLTLPEEANTEEARATYRDGILEITMPAREMAKPKRVEIRTEKEPEEAEEE